MRRIRRPGDPLPLRVELSEQAEAELDAAYRWMLSFGFAVAERWLRNLLLELDAEAAIQAVVPIYRQIAPDCAADCPVYILPFRASGRRSSPWNIRYEKLDEDEDGKPDTLRVLRIRHAARG